MNEYNGSANYPTWSVAHTLTNQEHFYNLLVDFMQLFAAFHEEGTGNPFLNFRDQYFDQLLEFGESQQVDFFDKNLNYKELNEEFWGLVE